MARRSSKKGKGLPSSVGKFDANAGLQPNAFTQVQQGAASGRKRQLPVRARGGSIESEDGVEESVGEGDYEGMPRSFEKSQKKRKKERLPIKTREGIIQYVEAGSEEEDGQEEEGEGGGSEGEGEMEWDGGSGDEEQGEVQDGHDNDNEPKQPLPTKAEQRQQILEAKEELAQIGLSLNEDPEENVRPPPCSPPPNSSQLAC